MIRLASQRIEVTLFNRPPKMSFCESKPMNLRVQESVDNLTLFSKKVYELKYNKMRNVMHYNKLSHDKHSYIDNKRRHLKS